MKYVNSFLSKEELETMLVGRIDSIELNKVLSAYEMADFGYGSTKCSDGSSFFFHTTRVCKILINELSITDTNLLVASLLYDIFRNNKDITPSIISYNFGTYTAYLLEILNIDYDFIPDIPAITDIPLALETPNPQNDYLILWLSIHLDNIRCLSTGIDISLLKYYFSFSDKLIYYASQNENSCIKQLAKQIQSEKNKFLG